MTRLAQIALLAAIVLLGFRAPGQETPPVIVFQGETGNMVMGGFEFGGSGRWLASLTDNATVRVLDATNGRLIANLTDTGGVPVLLMAPDPQQDRLAVALKDGSVSIMDITTGKQVWRVTAPSVPAKHVMAVTGLRFSADGTRLQALISVTPPARFRMPKPEVSLYVWDPGKGTLLENRPIPFQVRSFSSDGRWMFGSQMGRTLRGVVVDLATTAQVGPEIDGHILTADPKSGKALVMPVSKSGSGATRLVDILSGRDLAADLSYAYGGAFSPDGKLLAVTGGGFGWRLVDASTGQVKFAGSGAQPMPTSAGLSFAPDGAHFAISHLSPLLVSTSDPAQYRALGEQTVVMTAGEVSSSGLIPRGPEDRVRELSKNFNSLPGATPAASFTKDGRWLITRSADGQLDFFDAATGNKMPFRVPTNPGSKQPLFAAENGRYVYVKSNMRTETKAVPMKVGRQVVNYEVERKAFSTESVDTLTGRITGKAEFNGVRCSSAGGEFAVEFTPTGVGTGRATLRSADGSVASDLPPGMNLSAGCSISADGKYIAIAGGEPSRRTAGFGTDSQDMIFGDRFGFLKTLIDIYDVAGKRSMAALEDSAQRKPGKFPFSASSLLWTPDGRYIMGGGKSPAMEYVNHGPVRIWEAATGRERRVVPDSENLAVLAISQDATAILTKTPGGQTLRESFGVDMRDAASGAVRYTLPSALAAPDMLVFSPDGKTIIGPDRDGAISIWSRSDGLLLGQLRAMQEGEWLITSPEGLFDGSPRAWSLISWRDANHSLQTAPGEIYFNEFYRPGLLAEVLDGRRLPLTRAITSIDRRQPLVSVSAVVHDNARATVRVTATEAAPTSSNPRGSGVKDLRLFRNGLLVKAWRGELPLDAKGSTTVEATVAASAGENRFSAYVFNRENIRSAESTTLVKVAGSRRTGVAYVIGIGVNRYSNAEFNLKYAVPDAEALALELAGRQKELGQFSVIRPVTLKDAQATSANIRLALARLTSENPGPLPAGAPEELKTLQLVRPEDALILYFAGHGIASGDRFYLIPHDLGYNGPRSQIRANIATLLEHGISDLDLQQALEPIAARHITLIIDACQSGQALASDDDRRGPMNSRGLAQLAWEKGMSILAASEAYQAALESSRLGHGYLTFALTQEGLKTPAADTTPQDGSITEREWLEYAARRVPQLQIEAFESARQNNRALTLEVVSGDAPSSRLQSPRLFTRRDLSGAALVVAKF